MEQFGIENTKEALAFGFAFQRKLSEGLSDGKFDFTEIISLAPTLLKAPSAFEAIKKIPDEIKELSDSEKDELYAYIVEEFDIANDEVEDKIEKVLKWLLDTYDLARELFDKRA